MKNTTSHTEHVTHAAQRDSFQQEHQEPLAAFALKHALPTMRPEARLVIACARSSFDAATTAALCTLLSKPLNWTYIARVAHDHRVLPLVYNALTKVSTEAVPAAPLRMLRDAFHTNAQQVMYRTGELVKLLTLLEAHNIPTIPYKGPMLGAFAYRNLALRPFDDLDIFIHKHDVGRTRALLQAQGYESALHLTPMQEVEHLRKHHDYLFVHADTGTVVEVQWGVMQHPFTFPPNEQFLWKNLDRTVLAGAHITTLPPERLLLVLCVHASKHLWGRLVWISDVAEHLRAHRTLDWQAMMRQARVLGVERQVLLGLLLAHLLLDVAVPDDVVQRAYTTAAVNALTTQVLAGLVDSRNVLERIEEDAPLFYLRMMDRWQDRLRLCVHLYPTLLHPVRLVQKYGLQSLRYLWGY